MRKQESQYGVLPMLQKSAKETREQVRRAFFFFFFCRNLNSLTPISGLHLLMNKTEFTSGSRLVFG